MPALGSAQEATLNGVVDGTALVAGQQIAAYVAGVLARVEEGLVGGEGFAVDASLIAADANKQRSIPGDQWRIGGLDADAWRAVPLRPR